MNMSLIPNMPQRTDELEDQLSDLLKVSKRLGLHKAMKYLEEQINEDK